MPQYYDRYKEFRDDNTTQPIPGITIPLTTSDKKVVYKVGSRLDKISQEYYGTPYFGWLIMLCNQEYGGLEFDIPFNKIIVVPFPLEDAINRYIKVIKEHKRLNG